MVPRINHEMIDSIEYKWCGKCKTYKQIDKFGKSKQTWDNLRPTCKDCLHEYNVQTKKRKTEYNKLYWQKTMELQKEKNKKWRENNQERFKEHMKQWLEKNKEYKKKKDAEYRKNNWDKKKAYLAKWNRINYANMKSDPNRKIEFAKYKIKYNTSRRIREILGKNKLNTCINYIGCTLDKFRILLETKFQDGMCWKNYGENIHGGKTRVWHIDHKIPIKAFDLSNVIHKQACFHYKNTQPLWWDDNIRKKASFDKFKFDNYIKWYIDVYVS